MSLGGPLVVIRVISSLESRVADLIGEHVIHVT